MAEPVKLSMLRKVRGALLITLSVYGLAALSNDLYYPSISLQNQMHNKLVFVKTQAAFTLIPSFVPMFRHN